MSGDVLGVVLAGGASRRMGRDKAALEIAGRPLLAWVAEALREAFGGVMVVGPPQRAALVPGTPVVADDYPGQGPLGGIATALRHAGTRRIFVAACDMPFLRPELARHLAALAPEAAAVVPRSDRGLEPLCACYGSACLPIAEMLLANGQRAMADLLVRVVVRAVQPEEWSAWDATGRALVNVNTPEDLEAARRAFL